LLTFTSVYFSESGLFNWLRPVGVKKFPCAISGCARLSEVNFGDVCFLRVGSPSTVGFDPATANGIAQISIFAKDTRWLSVDLHSVPKKARAEGICAIKKRPWLGRQTWGQSI
jgi:hypothetical protein